MDSHTHFLFPFTIGLALNKINLLSIEIALICGVLGAFIDIDHYIMHMILSKSKKFSFVATWNNAIKFHRFNPRSFIHYWPGIFYLSIAIIIMFFINFNIGLVLAIAYYSHLLLDRIPAKRFVRWRLGPLYMKQSYLELTLDAILVVLIIVMLLI